MTLVAAAGRGDRVAADADVAVRTKRSTVQSEAGTRAPSSVLCRAGNSVKENGFKIGAKIQVYESISMKWISFDSF